MDSKKLTRDELKAKLHSKINSKSSSRKYTINRKKGTELQEKLLKVKNLLDENNISNVNDLNETNKIKLEEINNILTGDDFKYLLTKLANNPELVEILTKFKNEN
jgi:hypothetical protein